MKTKNLIHLFVSLLIFYTSIIKHIIYILHLVILQMLLSKTTKGVNNIEPFSGLTTDTTMCLW